MKFVRLLALAFAGAAAAFAQVLFDRTTLDGFFPAWALNAFPRLSGMERWQASDLRTLAILLSAAAALTFGFVVPAWVNSTERRAVQGSSALTPSAWRRPGLLLGLAALAALGAAGLAAGRGGWLATLLWLAGAVLAVAAGAAADGLRPRSTAARDIARPEESWPWLLAIVLLALMLASRDRGDLPGVIPPPGAEAAHQALRMAGGDGPGWLERGSARVAGLATLPAALFIWSGGNPLRGGATAGALAAALLTAGVWLIGCELFRRPPWVDAARAPQRVWIEDDGRLPALLAALALATSAPLMHFGRFAGQIEPVAVGVFGLWATLRGTRTARLRLIGLGGALSALAAGMAPGGVVLLVTAALLWPGIWLLRSAWLRPRAGWPGAWAAAYWCAAALITGLPLLAAPGNAPGIAQPALLDGGFSGSLGRSFLGLVALPDAGGWAAFPLHMLSNWLAPFLLLALGALLFSFDSLPGWALVIWLGTGVALAALAPAAPAWQALLPTLPAAALAVAFALDRTRAALAAYAGAWAARAANSLSVGIICLAALTTWAGYSWAAAPGDSASATVRAALAAPEGTPLLLTTGSPDAPGWDEPRLRHLATYPATGAGPRLQLAADAPQSWPQQLPPGSLVFIPPPLQTAAAELQARYGVGRLETVRDGRANPVLYIWVTD